MSAIILPLILWKEKLGSFLPDFPIKNNNLKVVWKVCIDIESGSYKFILGVFVTKRINNET